jgi:addiction module HigA family antidote
MPARILPPIHPGEVLLEEFLKPMGLSQYRLAKEIHVPSRRINEIVLGTRSISPDTALRLSRYFGLSERFWLNLQGRFDLETEKDRLADRLEREVRVHAAAQHPVRAQGATYLNRPIAVGPRKRSAEEQPARS